MGLQIMIALLFAFAASANARMGEFRPPSPQGPSGPAGVVTIASLDSNELIPVGKTGNKGATGRADGEDGPAAHTRPAKTADGKISGHLDLAPPVHRRRRLLTGSSGCYSGNGC